MDIQNSNSIYSNLGDIFVAYTHTIRPHAHREPLRAKLIGVDGSYCHEAQAMTILKMISERKDDGVTYSCETDLSQGIPETVAIRASCTGYFWWFGHEKRSWDETYDPEKGYFDLYPYINPFGTDFSRGIHLNQLVDHHTGEVLKDEQGRNLAVYGYMKWSLLKDAATELFNEGKAFDFLEDGIPHFKIAHVDGHAYIKQNPKTGIWKAH